MSTDHAPAETLPAAWYHRADVFARERERIFRRSWWLIGPEAALAETGACQATTAGSRPVLAVRAESGELRAFHNVCRHRAGPLLEDGYGTCKALVCRYHGWRYGLDGTLKSAPGLADGPDLAFADHGLFPARADVWNGLVFVRPDPDGPDLEDWLGEIVDIARRFPGPPDMAFQSDVANDRPINWKTYADNGCEGYHVGMVHGALSKAVDAQAIDVRGYPNGDFVGFDVTNADGTRAFWVLKFPGLLLHFGETAFNAETVRPLGPARTALQRWFWVDEDAARARGLDAAGIVSASSAVVGEDLEICEAVQRNLQAGVYETGVVIPEKEPGTAFFQAWVRRMMDKV